MNSPTLTIRALPLRGTVLVDPVYFYWLVENMGQPTQRTLQELTPEHAEILMIKEGVPLIRVKYAEEADVL